ncbi:MAG TPA: glutamate--cysteine ligase [Porticoccaceae bacterium]|nr:glutamate--cysteine ligase [Porticoccaceae bacterium]
MSPFDRRLRLLEQPGANATLDGILRGLEKESLRVDSGGCLSQRPHPPALGSALTHPSITTDYSEALLEFITPPSTSVAATLAALDQLHRFTYGVLDDELLWVNSMPCVLGRDEDIPVARYGTSNIGRMKTVYRVGLGHRYGRLMQTISGIHYNWSLPDATWTILHAAEAAPGESLRDYKTRRYFDLIRNFRRYFWLLLYLFGAAPAVCRTFVQGRPHRLVPFGADQHSLHTPHATSLRMGDLGYQSQAQQQLGICYNGLDSYLEHLRRGLTTPYPAYEAIGVRDASGEYRQLSAGLLQIENEFYSTIRPKRPGVGGEVPLQALRRRGVEYIEVRCVDLNPYEPNGIEPTQIRFLDMFLLFCLLGDSQPTDEAEYRLLQANQLDVVYRGRDPGLALEILGRRQPLRDWARELFVALAPLAALLDRAQHTEAHAAALRMLAARIDDSSTTPAARLLAEMKDTGQTYFQTALGHAERNRDHFLSVPLAAETLAGLREQAAQSLRDQAALEAGDRQSFESFLAAYYAQYGDARNGLDTKAGS